MLPPEINAGLASLNFPPVVYPALTAYFTALGVVGYRLVPPGTPVPSTIKLSVDSIRPDTPVRTSRRSTRAENAIIAVLGTETSGMTTAALTKKIPTVKGEQFEPSLAALKEAGKIYSRGARWFIGAGPVTEPAVKTEPVTTTEPAKTAPRTRSRAGTGNGDSLADALLEAAGNLPPGSENKAYVDYLATKKGMTVRPNHAGIGLERHVRANRLVKQGQGYTLPAQAKDLAA
jgi:hypothetical protein